MLKENIITNLKEFGLSNYEAKAYLALTIKGPMTASGIAENGKIPQSKVYGILKSLSGKFLTETWNGKPIKFKAVEPFIALNKIVERKKITINILKEKTDVIARQIKPLIGFETDNFGLWSSSGKLACMEKAAEMLCRARKIGYATTSMFSRYPPLDNAYIAALKKGVKIRILGTKEIDNASKARASWYHNQGAEIRILPLKTNPILGIIDDNEISFRVDKSDSPDMIWSNNPALIDVFKSYFEDLWEKAEKFKL
jgi:HTH-type transcriptional regulator, sugar sensing transcriptional regulator